MKEHLLTRPKFSLRCSYLRCKCSFSLCCKCPYKRDFITCNLHRKLQKLSFPNQPLIFYDVVFHLLESANQGFTLLDCKLSFENCHQHIDSLLGKSMRIVLNITTSSCTLVQGRILRP